jgi:hypothetical protein
MSEHSAAFDVSLGEKPAAEKLRRGELAFADIPTGEAGEESIMSTMRNRSLAMAVAAVVSLGGAFALCATSPSQAAPLSVNALALKEATPDHVVDVRRRGRHYGGHAFAGLALGVIGAVIAHQAYKDSRRYHRRHHYQPYGYYGPPSCIRRHGAWYCR